MHGTAWGVSPPADIWTCPWKQQFTSARTARPQVPAMLRMLWWLPDTLNVDIGGGPYSLGTLFLEACGVRSLVYDPFNRPEEHNLRVAAEARGGKCDTATVANVLNVIREPEVRRRVIQLAADAVGQRGVAFFCVHRDATRRAGPTPCGWQEQRRLATYIPEVEAVFEKVGAYRGMIVARAPRNQVAGSGSGRRRKVAKAGVISPT